MSCSDAGGIYGHEVWLGSWRLESIDAQYSGQWPFFSCFSSFFSCFSCFSDAPFSFVSLALFLLAIRDLFRMFSFPYLGLHLFSSFLWAFSHLFCSFLLLFFFSFVLFFFLVVCISCFLCVICLPCSPNAVQRLDPPLVSSQKWYIGIYTNRIHPWLELQPWIIITRIRLPAVKTLGAPLQAATVNGSILNTANQKQGQWQALTSDRETLDPNPIFCVSAAISGRKIWIFHVSS